MSLWFLNCSGFSPFHLDKCTRDWCLDDSWECLHWIYQSEHFVFNSHLSCLLLWCACAHSHCFFGHHCVTFSSCSQMDFISDTTCVSLSLAPHSAMRSRCVIWWCSLLNFSSLWSLRAQSSLFLIAVSIKQTFIIFSVLAFRLWNKSSNTHECEYKWMFCPLTQITFHLISLIVCSNLSHLWFMAPGPPLLRTTWVNEMMQTMMQTMMLMLVLLLQKKRKQNSRNIFSVWLVNTSQEWIRKKSLALLGQSASQRRPLCFLANLLGSDCE